MASLFIYNIGRLATPLGTEAKRGKEQAAIHIRDNCCITVRDGIISEIADYAAGVTPVPEDCFDRLDAEGGLVTPGLIDCHTHLVFGGWRHGELPLKLAGASYLEILENGGGILSTVEHTRAATHEQLVKKAQTLLDEYLNFGVTTLEAKSGYGLDTESELKTLEVINELDHEHPVDLAATFLGAHAMPKEYAGNREAFVDKVCNEMIPLVAEKKLAEFCDVFCEKGAFDLEESKRILETAKAHGLRLKIHAEEINNLGGAKMGAALGCISAEHLIKIDSDGINAMAESGTIAVCLPCTSFYLNEDFAPARKMIEAGVPVAVSTDFNPGSSPNLNIQLAMNMACYRYKMQPPEILTAVTLNAAAAIGRADTIGTLECGKKADIVIWSASDLNYIFYRYGSNLVRDVVKNGEVFGDERVQKQFD